ncbi:ABC transporter substrate-binding protein [Boseongicola aestuarii]|uniref:Periplasmic dipeptide transport protein n=1 Tax=Boseongicola aestuarii TaxID=1470561 RepID=A0A238J4K5_9RHOB|nr:ABC transporter substrate-binding protein [Boseongicola aestuarii]SMX25251.1 Periplasmic dipeptide transport protein precursor [Boseongicola aestuarii]
MLTLARRGFLQGLGVTAGASMVPLIASAQTRRNVVVGVQRLPENISPGRDTSDFTVPISYNVFDKLIELDFQNQMAPAPGLATSWEIKDHKEITFRLREGVKFHNGDTMTAEDVAFTYSKERRESDGPVRLSQFFSNIAEVHVVDPLTVRIVMDGVDPILEQRFAMWSGEVVNKRAYLAAESYAAWALNPVGTGPFKVDSLNTDAFNLIAFDDHWRGQPNIASLKFVEVPEVAGRIAGLASGDFDMITVVPADQIDTIESYGDIEVVGGPGAKMRILIFNQGEFAHPMMKNVHFRRALSLSVDRQLIADALFAGRASVPNGLQLPSFGDIYDASYPKPAYDLARAKEELTLSGYNGEVIDYPLLPNVIDTEVAVAEVLAEMWRGVGINVELQIRENWKQITKAHHSIRNMSATMVWQDPATVLWRLFKPSVIKGRGWGWENEAFISGGKILEENPDPVARRQAFKTMMEEWETNDPMGIVLFQEVWLYGKKKDLDWQPYTLPYLDFGPANI